MVGDGNKQERSHQSVVIAEAAARIGADEASVRKLVEAGHVAGAFQLHEDGNWLIPVEALVDLQATIDSKLPTSDAATEQADKTDDDHRVSGWLASRWRKVAAVLGAMAVLSGGVASCDQLASRVESILPDPPPFAPATEDEILIVIADFEDLVEPGTNADDEIRGEVKERIELLGLDSARVENLDETIDRTDSSGRVDEIGEELGASIVVWGERTAVTMIVQFRIFDDIEAPFEPKTEHKRSGTEGQATVSPSHLPPKEQTFIEELIPNAISFVALYLIAITEHLNGDTAEAVRLLSEGIDLAAERTDDESSLADAYFTLGYFQEIVNNHQEAVAAYDQAINLYQEGKVAFYNRGNAYLELGEYQSAIDDYDDAIGLDLTLAFNNRGIAYDRLGDYQEAINDFNDAIQLDPGDAIVLHNLGVTYLHLGDEQEAISYFDQAIDLDPSYANAFANRGLAHSSLGEYEQGIQDYDAAINLDPNNADAFNNRGIAFALLGDQMQAIDSFSNSIELEPNNTDSFLSRGTAYNVLGQHEEASQDFESAVERFDRVIEVDPQDATAFIGQGHAYALLDEQQKALDAYDRAIELIESGQSTYNLNPSFAEDVRLFRDEATKLSQ